jgi:branched-chain amino acid transport system substrate-binding protein
MMLHIAEGKMKSRRTFVHVLGASSLAITILFTVTATSGASSSGSIPKGDPVLIGASLSLSGQFFADGQAFEAGYKLWAKEQNAAGGLLGHKIKLKIVSDASSPTQVVTNYQNLISTDHVNLTFGPFSSLLTLPAAKAVDRYGYAMVEGAGGAPSVFHARLKNVFDSAMPVADGLVPFASWVASLPSSHRPKTVAYVTSNDPFTEPQIPVAESILKMAGVKSVYYHVFSSGATDYTPVADAVAAAKAQIVVLGSVDVPTVSAFMQAFERAHYNPKAFIATAGPDQGAAFIKVVGAKNADGMLVPDSWFGGSTNPESEKMVAEYIKQYGGTAAGVNADVAEAYSVGQVITAAVKATGGFSNAKIISYLHSGVTIQSVLGEVKFNSLGENPDSTAYTFQWQGADFVEVNPATDPGATKVLYPKPAWSTKS